MPPGPDLRKLAARYLTAARSPAGQPLDPVARFHLGNGARRALVLIMFAMAGYAIWLSAEPFAKGLVATGKNWGVDEFMLVQWLARARSR